MDSLHPHSHGLWCILKVAARPGGPDRHPFTRCHRLRFKFPGAAAKRIFLEGRPGVDQFPEAGQVLRMPANGRLTALPHHEESDGHKLRSGMLFSGSLNGPEARGTTLDTNHFGTRSGSRIPRAFGHSRLRGLESRKLDLPVPATHLLSVIGGAVSRG